MIYQASPASDDHEHTDGCYKLICEEEEHTHTDECCRSPNGLTDPLGIAEALVRIETKLTEGVQGRTYDLLSADCVTVSPAQYDSIDVQLQIASVTKRVSDSEEMSVELESDGQSLTIPTREGAVYTIRYEAYIQVDGQMTVFATKEVSLTVMSDEDNGGQLDGDFAYLDDVTCTLKTGTHVDGKSKTAPGYDPSEDDNILRTYDLATYTLAYTSRVRDGAPFRIYREGVLCYEFTLDASPEQAIFDSDFIDCMKAKPYGECTLTASPDGKSQTIQGSFLWTSDEETEHTIDECRSDLEVSIRALAMKNGETLAPTFTLWLEHNLAGDYRTVGGDEDSTIIISAAPSYNLRLATATASKTNRMGTWNFASGNDLALDKDAGEVSGRIDAVGMELQIRHIPGHTGLVGVELPDDSTTFVFDLELTSKYNGKDVTSIYTPLVWSLDENCNDTGQQDERTLPPTLQTQCVDTLPLNRVEYDSTTMLALGNDHLHVKTCNNGGTWSAISTERGKVHVTITGLELDMTQLPCQWGEDGSTAP